jgi:alkaline phosphatase D
MPGRMPCKAACEGTAIAPSLRAMISRRPLLAAAALALTGAIPTRRPFAAAGTPFALGIASGEPGPDSVVLWTRVSGEGPVEVGWELAEDAALTRPLRAGRFLALPEDAHSVHLELGGLRPDRWYFYRFTAQGEASPIGRTRTAPAPGAMPARLRFAVASCQQYEHGYFGAWRQAMAEDPDLVVFLGDYIYEASWGRNLVRHHGAPAARDLAGYRDRYALYKSDPDLQAAHAACPWLVTWDDHEVSNDYAGDRGELLRGPQFLERRAAAYKAFWEHMPLPMAARPDGASARIYRRADFGGLARFHMLDDRQYRGWQACQRADRGGAVRVTAEACPALFEPRSLLGPAQEAWLAEGLARSPARWNFLGQQTLMARNGGGQAPPVYWTDGWDGYPLARRALLETMAAARTSNPVVLGGDVHAHVAAVLRPDFDRPETPAVAVEFTGTSITSQAAPRLREQIAGEPHIAFLDSRQRGWMGFELTPKTLTARMMAIDDPAERMTGARLLRRFVVEDGVAALTS